MIVGIIGDLHLPFTHPRYLEFIRDTFDAWNVDRVHFAGDIVDLHALSFWDIDPNGHSAERESELAAEMLVDWVRTFPDATVSIGNHDERHYRRARKAGSLTAICEHTTKFGIRRAGNGSSPTRSTACCTNTGPDRVATTRLLNVRRKNERRLLWDTYTRPDLRSFRRPNAIACLACRLGAALIATPTPSPMADRFRAARFWGAEL